MKPKTLLRHPILWQLLRFSVTGSLSSVTHFSSVIFLVELCHWHPLNANIIGFLNGFFVSFFGHRFWTFAGSKREIKSSLPAFFVTALSIFLFNQSLFYLFLTRAHLNYLVALLCALIMTSLCNFTISRRWVFHAHSV